MTTKKKSIKLKKTTVKNKKRVPDLEIADNLLKELSLDMYSKLQAVGIEITSMDIKFHII